MPDSRTHIGALDIARCLAILGVVIIHSGALFLKDHDSPALRSLLFASRFAVPLFIMISGYLHKDRSNAIRRRVHYKKFTLARFKRILVPYFIFSFFYLAVRIIIEQSPFFHGFVAVKYNSLGRILAAIFLVRDNPAGHLYFLPLLFFVIALFCLARETIRNTYLMVLTCIATSIVAYATAGSIFLSLNPLKGVGFYAFGYFARIFLHKQTSQQAVAAIFALSMAGYLLILIINGDLGRLTPFYRLMALFFYHLAGSFFLLQLSFYVSDMHWFAQLATPLKYIGKYSFTIFLWHEPYIVSALYTVLDRLSVQAPVFNQPILIAAGLVLPIVWSRYILATSKRLTGNLFFDRARNFTTAD